MLTINKNGHFEKDSKVLKSLNQVLKASTDYYTDKDASHVALAAGIIENAAITGRDMKKLITEIFIGHDPILQTEEGIKELIKLGLKRRKQAERREQKWKEEHGITEYCELPTPPIF